MSYMMVSLYVSVAQVKVLFFYCMLMLCLDHFKLWSSSLNHITMQLGLVVSLLTFKSVFYFNVNINSLTVTQTFSGKVITYCYTALWF